VREQGRYHTVKFDMCLGEAVKEKKRRFSRVSLGPDKDGNTI
jgi:hypothetical protein